MDIEMLMKALDNEDNDLLFNYTSKKIKELNYKILKELELDTKETLDILNKLKEYKYVDEMDELKHGRYLRYICLKDPDDLSLKKGGIFCDTSIHDNGVSLILKTPFNKHFQIKMDEHLIFQKLSPQELVLLSAIDHLVTK